MNYDIDKVNLSTYPVGSAFIVDTNILLFLFYAKASSGQYNTQNANKVGAYSNFIGSVCSNKHKLIIPASVLTELYHKIELTEYKSSQYFYSCGNTMRNFKQFRCDPVSRKYVKMQIFHVINQVNALNTGVMNVSLVDIEIEKFLLDYELHSLDTFDFCMAQNAKQTPYSNIITDDTDFLGCSNFDIFTFGVNLSCSRNHNSYNF